MLVEMHSKSLNCCYVIRVAPWLHCICAMFLLLLYFYSSKAFVAIEFVLHHCFVLYCTSTVALNLKPHFACFLEQLALLLLF